MLKHSPQLHLIVDYGVLHTLSAKDEKGVLLALQSHDRIRYIDINPSPDFSEKLFAVMNVPFPVLEHLVPRVEDPDTDEDESEGTETDCPQFPPSSRPRIFSTLI